jgi:hypothetical protein
MPIKTTKIGSIARRKSIAHPLTFLKKVMDNYTQFLKVKKFML